MSIYDEIERSITNNGLTRLARQAGVRSLKSNAYVELRFRLQSILSDFLNKVEIFTSYTKRKTVHLTDIQEALRRNEYLKGVVGGLPTKMCKPYSGKDVTKEIDYYQTEVDSQFLIPVASFERVIRKEMDYHGYYWDTKSFSAESLRLIQYVIERHLVDLLSMANSIAEHCGHKRVAAKDIALVYKVQIRKIIE